MRNALAAFAALTLAGPALAQPAAPAVLTLKNAAGAAVGQASVRESARGVVVRIEAKDLPPGWHGLHFHEKGDCSKSDFTSAGAHVHDKPSVVHGLLNPDGNEAGDLPNLFVAADGSANAELFSPYLKLKAESGAALADADGSALVIHAAADDHISQPIGGSGARIACGVLAGAAADPHAGHAGH